MDADSEGNYRPPSEFIENTKDSLVELSVTDSKELWLIQWPVNQVRFSLIFSVLHLL